LDIKAFFDSIETELLMRAVHKHTDCPWVLLYIGRWLKAPVQMADGSLVGRQRGTPQGGVISPLLANLFLHYAFDMWMRRNFPDIPFERYADDAICHCRTEDQATALGPVAIYVGIDWRVFGRHEAIRSCGEVNDLIVWFLGEGLPSVDLAHGDLS